MFGIYTGFVYGLIFFMDVYVDRHKLSFYVSVALLHSYCRYV